MPTLTYQRRRALPERANRSSAKGSLYCRLVEDTLPKWRVFEDNEETAPFCVLLLSGEGDQDIVCLLATLCRELSLAAEMKQQNIHGSSEIIWWR